MVLGIVLIQTTVMVGRGRIGLWYPSVPTQQECQRKSHQDCCYSTNTSLWMTKVMLPMKSWPLFRPATARMALPNIDNNKCRKLICVVTGKSP